MNRGAQYGAPRAFVSAFLLALFTAALPAAAQQEPPLDASLRRLLQPEVRARVTAHGIIRPGQPLAEQPFAGAYSLHTDAAGRIRVAVFLELPVPGGAAVLDALQAVGAEIGSVVGDIAAVRVPLDALEVLGTLPIRRAESARLLHSTHDSSMVATGAHLVRQRTETGWSGSTGAGAIVGIVDSGVDITHPDFLDDAGATRIAGVWDQLVGSTPPPGFTYGFHCTRAAVQTAITTGNLAACPTTDMVGHGTHVAGTAAGSGVAAAVPFRYAGMAPEAELLVVRAGNSTFAEDRLIDGVVWLHGEAQSRGRPMVVNLSLGHQFGPHDGSLLFERMLDQLSGPGFVIVVAAGNDGVNMTSAPAPAAPRLIHARASIASGQTAAVQFRITPYTPAANLCTGNLVDLSAWYDVRDHVEISVVRPDGSRHTAPTGTGSVQDHPLGRIDIQNAVPLHAHQATAEGSIQVNGCGESGAPAPGTWTVIFRPLAAGGGHAPVDLYINAVRLGPGGTATGTTGFDNRYVVGSPGNARRVITVGAFITRNCWPTERSGEVCYAAHTAVGNLAAFSSGGPTRDGRQKPEITAPGAAIISALSRHISAPPGRVAPGGRHWVLEGTSMAAPHVTGAVALLLAHRASLTPEDVREILMRSARQDAFTHRVYDLAPAARPSDWWGAGKLDVPAALAELLGSGAVAAVRLTQRADTIPVGGTLQLQATITGADGQPVFANLVWTSLDPATAAVSAHGVVRGTGPGVARIVVQAGPAADTTRVVVQPAAVLTMTAASIAPAVPLHAPEGTLLPLLALRLEATGPEAVDVLALAFEVAGADLEARLVLLEDAAGDGRLDPGARVIASRTAPLGGPPRTLVVNTDTLRVPRNSVRHLILAMELSGFAVTGSAFTARLVPDGTRTLAVNSRLADRFVLGGTLASDAAVATVLRPGELFALSENPVRRDDVLFNFAARPALAAVYTATGSRVADLLPRFDGLTLRWDLTSDDGRRIVPGVYLLVFRVDGRLVRERIIVLSPRLDGGG
jgi:subtilisin family serine protease